MDFALERLVRDPSCRTPTGEFTGELCRADDAAFKRLVNQFGGAIAPTAMYPARTTGYGGFEISLEGAYTTVNSEADYMRRGTRGASDPETGQAATENDSPASLLQVYSLRIRKGFGFGLETGLQFGVIPKTSLISGGLDLRVAILEGFREGPMGYVPDLAAAGSVRTITGTAQMQLTVASVNGVLSKPIVVGQSGEITPWVGYQYMWIFGDSGVIDFTPTTDALQACNYVGPDQPGVDDPTGTPDRGGEPLCDGGTSDDFNNNQVFRSARIQRQRLFFGLNYRYEILTIGGQVMFDLVPPSEINAGPDQPNAFEDDPTQVTVALQVGTTF